MKYNWDKLTGFQEDYALAILKDIADKVEREWSLGTDMQPEIKDMIERLTK